MTNILSGKLAKNFLFFVFMFMSGNSFAQVSFWHTGFSVGNSFRASTPEGVAAQAEVYLNANLPANNSWGYMNCRPNYEINLGPNRHDFVCSLYNNGNSPSFPCCTVFAPLHRVGAIGRSFCPAAQNANAPFDIFDDETMQCGCSNPVYEARNRPGLSTPEVGCFALPEDDAKEDHGCTGEKGVGNPCNVATGNKYQSEPDFTNGALSLNRSYNSQNLAQLGLGKGWRHNFQRKLIVTGNSVAQVSGTGRGEPWIKVNGLWQGEADTDVAIVEVPSGFQLTKANSIIENYNSAGQIQSVIDTNGQQTIYTYNADETLAQVTNHYGLSLSFTYVDEMLSSVTDALGSEYRYEYDQNDNLLHVIYPDSTPSDATDNPRRTYHYEMGVNYPSHLTGISDENGDRYATWAYNSEGKAISTEHAPTTNTIGQERFELDYQTEAAQ